MNRIPSKFGIQIQPADVVQSVVLVLKQLRKRVKWSQAELAERSGVSLGSIKRFERTGKISLESLLKLLHILDYLEKFDHAFELSDNPDELEALFSDKIRTKKA